VTPAIETRGLTRRFGGLVAVDSLDLTVDRGGIYGFLGRNGAGKTTLIRMLLGLIRPTQGSVRLLGRAVGSRGGPRGPWTDVGYLVEGPGLYPDLTVADHLAIATGYRAIPRAAVADLVDRLALNPYRRVRARALSLGNRQRLGLALALAHRPALLVLDEPGNGLDPAGVVEVRALLRELADSGVTVFMSSHLVAEVARLADRVGIIHEGRLVEEVTADRVRALGAARVRAALPDPAQAVPAAECLRAAGFTVAADGDSVTSADVAALAHPERVASVLVLAGFAPRELTTVSDDLEQHFLHVTGDGP
jgi:ABC-2 type transport system ATP-binding protein